jgi:O-antigen ligase
METKWLLHEIAPFQPAADSGRRVSRDLLDYAAPAAVLLLLYAGYFKANPLLSWVPVDLTFLGAALTLTGICAVLIRSIVPRGTGVVLGLWATFMPAAIFFAPGGYGGAKALHLFTLTLLSALGPLFLVRSRMRQETWVVMQIALGTVMAFGTALSPVPGQAAGEIYRLALDGSGPIAAGRASGVAVTGCFVLALAGHRKRLWLVLLGAAVAVPLFLSGSRGPVAAAAIAVAVVAVVAPASGTRRLVRVLLVATGGIAAWYWVRGDTTGGAGRIATTLLTGNLQDNSSRTRFTIWHDAWSYIPHHIWGAGWGGLPDVAGFSLLGQDGLIYPHNFILEVAGEAGWIAGIGVILFLWVGLRRLRAAAVSPYPSALFGMAVFFAVNAMVSGDVNDNRVMWASVAIAWVVVSRRGTDLPVPPGSPWCWTASPVACVSRR